MVGRARDRRRPRSTASSSRRGDTRATTWPGCATAGRRRGRTSGPYVQGEDVTRADGRDGRQRRRPAAVRGGDDARRRPRRSPPSCCRLPGANLGDPIDYGAYLIGQLTGSWQSATAATCANDGAARCRTSTSTRTAGYAYQCWDYTRHASSMPPGGHLRLDADVAGPVAVRAADDDAPLETRRQVDQDGWRTRSATCTATTSRCNVPQRYDAGDNPHHRSRYDPLKRLAHHYLPRAGLGLPPRLGQAATSQVSEAEMRAAGMSPTGRMAGVLMGTPDARPPARPIDATRRRGSRGRRSGQATPRRPDIDAMVRHAPRSIARARKAQVELDRDAPRPGPGRHARRSSGRCRAPTGCGRSF